MWFLTESHIHFFLHFLIKENPLKISMQGNNLHIFYETFKSEFKKFFFQNPKIFKFGMPKS